MKKFIKYIPFAAIALAGAMTSCVKDLDVEPISNALVDKNKIEAYQLLNKCYANFGTAGNGGANGDCDIDGMDGGTSGLVRQVWNSNELTTDEAICGWGDPGIPQFCYNTYNSSHPMLEGLYFRLTTGISFCNQYLADFADADPTMTAEARFLRALQYYLLMDAFGNIPFSLEVTTTNPVQYTRAQAFEFIESELKAIIGENPEDNANILRDAKAKKSSDQYYGTADKAAAWMLLARLYLNAEVYTGTARWADAATYAKKVIDSDYKLLKTGSSKEVNRGGYTETWEYTPYQMLFMGDNDKTDAAYEAIFPIIQDGKRTTSWGVSLFLMASTYDGDMHENRYITDAVNGVAGQAWGGNRARPQLVRLFFPESDYPEADLPEAYSYDNATIAGDDRALLSSVGRTLNVTTPGTFTNGWAVAKFNNYTTDGSTTSDGTFPDTDMFFMRKAEAYLTYAEALIRLNGGTSNAEAKAAIDEIRNRAHASIKTTYSLNDMLDEWGREFYFEGRRRVDLIRFNRFGGTTDYNWQWKGGAYGGANFSANLNVFALPTSDLNSNPNLKQNPGY